MALSEISATVLPNTMLNTVADYPVAAYSLETTTGRNLSLGEALRRYDKPVIGGLTHRNPGYYLPDEGLPMIQPVSADRARLQRPTLATGTPSDVLAEAVQAARDSGGRRWIVGPGCNIAAETPEENIEALRQALPTLV